MWGVRLPQDITCAVQAGHMMHASYNIVFGLFQGRRPDLGQPGALEINFESPIPRKRLNGQSSPVLRQARSGRVPLGPVFGEHHTE